MSRRSAAVLAGALVLPGTLATASPAAAVPQPGVSWAGKTSEGGNVFLRTVRRDGVRHVVYFQADFTLTCEGTGEVVELTFGSQPDAPVLGGPFAHDEVVFNTAFHLEGYLGTVQGTGTASLALAGFTPDEETQRCDDGPVQWKVHRRTGSAVARSADTRVDVRGGSVAITERTVGVGGDEPVRPWFGETRQGFGLFFETIGRPPSRRIGTYDIAAFAPCPSSDLAVALQILGYADLPLDHGAWRIDEVSLFAATHWAGAIAKGVARGTLEMSLPAFTPEEAIEVCTSGEVLWRAQPGPVSAYRSLLLDPHLLTVRQA